MEKIYFWCYLMFLQEVHHVVKNALSVEETDHICMMAHAERLRKSEVQDGDTKNRSSMVTWINDNQVVDIITEKIHLANAESFKFNLSTIEPLQFSRYEIDDHYDWHIDSHFEPYNDGTIRKLSFTVTLNNEYTGGEFELTVPNPKNIDTSLIYKKPNVGDLILFPSHIWHKVHPVKSGVRKSLVGWVLGKPFV